MRELELKNPMTFTDKIYLTSCSLLIIYVLFKTANK